MRPPHWRSQQRGYTSGDAEPSEARRTGGGDLSEGHPAEGPGDEGSIATRTSSDLISPSLQ